MKRTENGNNFIDNQELFEEGPVRAEEENEEEEAEGLYEHFRVTADPGQTPLRLDKFLVDRLSGTARNRIQNAAKAGNILVNG